MEFPNFFSEAPTITLRDPLAAFLGLSKSGVISYAYADAVKLAGHSCPIVAGAYLMVRRGLSRLYGDELPERGNVKVYLRAPRDEGTTGVIVAVATLLTGLRPRPASAASARAVGSPAAISCVLTRRSKASWRSGEMTMGGA